MDFDAVIIGAGLAGTTVAWHMVLRNLRPLLCDDLAFASASRVAAGLINPITGYRLALTWKLDPLLPFAKTFYRHISDRLGVPLFSPLPMVKLFTTEEEVAIYHKKRDKEFRGLVEAIDPPLPAAVSFPLGGYQTALSGRLDVPAWLQATQDYFKQNKAFHSGRIDLRSGVLVREGSIEVQSLGVKARWLIDCTGTALESHPEWFPVCFNSAKGEILTLSIPDLSESRILNAKSWLIPLGNGIFRTGATFDRVRADSEPTEAGRQEVLEKLSRFLSLPCEVMGHQAAVRPVIREGQPVLGRHPKLAVAMLNSLGSKGSLLAPYFSHQLVQHLWGGHPLDPEVDYQQLPVRYRTPVLS